MNSPKLLPALALFVLAVLAGCEESPPPNAAAPAPQVTVSPPVSREIVDWDDYIGRFEAVDRVELRPRVSGYLVEVHFEDGQWVEAGEPLFSIDPRPFEAALAQAEGRVAAARTRVENARAELERARPLEEIQAISTEEFETLGTSLSTGEAELNTALAARRAAELDLDFTTIEAPISGRVSDRRVDPGNAVREDQTVLTTLVSVDPIHFSFQGSEAQFLRFQRAHGERDRNGTPVRLSLQGEERWPWQGKLDFMDNAIDPRTGTIHGRAVFDNPEGFLTPGMFGHMQLRASDAYGGLLLPDTAIATRGAQRIVYVVDEAGEVSARTVELGPLNDGLRVIRAGLDADDRVVIKGLQRAIPGSQVQAVSGGIDDAGAGGT